MDQHTPSVTLPTSPTAHAAGPRRDIQGLRALAVVMVVVVHAFPAALPGGYVGVDVFFVISGFLITGQLLRSRERTGTISLRSFWAKRIRRLLPASALVILATVVAAWLVLPAFFLPPVLKDAVASVLYVPNLRFAASGLDYWASTDPSLFKHFWSLGVEEQFYIVWPLLLMLVWRFRPRALRFALVVVIVASLIGSIVVTADTPSLAFYGLPTRAWEFALGGLLATFGTVALPRLVALVVSWAGLAGLLAIAFVFTPETPFPSYWALLPVLATVAVLLGADRPGTPVVVLRFRPVQYLGDISYSLYLWHWPVLTLVPLATGRPLGLRNTILAILLSLVLAVITHHIVEDPFRRARVLRTGRRTVGLAAGGIALVLIATTAFTFAPNGSPLAAGPAVAATSAVPLPKTVKPAIDKAAADVPLVDRDGCHSNNVLSVTSAACLYGSGPGPRVVLFGDSHAAAWFPAVAKAVGARQGSVLDLTKSACPPEWITVRNSSLQRDYRECDQWRAYAIKRINAFKPDVVILTGATGIYRPLVKGSFDTVWPAALKATQSRITAPTVVLSNTPLFAQAVPACLARHAADTRACSVSQATGVDARADTVEHSVSPRYLITSSFVCSDGSCPAIGGSIVRYRDSNHLTATFAATLSERLWASVIKRVPAAA